MSPFTNYRRVSINLCIHENTIFPQTTKTGIYEFERIHSINIIVCYLNLPRKSDASTLPS